MLRSGVSERTVFNHFDSIEDAHAWVEVFFAGYGWVPFDPTPIDESRRAELPWAPRPGTHGEEIADDD